MGKVFSRTFGIVRCPVPLPPVDTSPGTPGRSDSIYYRHTTVFAEWMVLTCLSQTGSIRAQERFLFQKGFRHLAGALRPAPECSLHLEHMFGLRSKNLFCP